MQFVLQGSDYGELYQQGWRCSRPPRPEQADADPGSRLRRKTPELQVTIEREQASQLGIPWSPPWQSSLQALLGGVSQTTYVDRGGV